MKQSENNSEYTEKKLQLLLNHLDLLFIYFYFPM